MKKIDYENYERPSDFMHFNQGANKIRIISDGFLGKKHGLKSAKGFVPLGLCTENGKCPHCLKGNDAKRFWKWIVFDVARNEVKLLDAGPMIGNAICELARQVKKDPKAFDIVISRTGEKLKTEYKVWADKESVQVTQQMIDDWRPIVAFLKNKYFQEGGIK